MFRTSLSSGLYLAAAAFSLSACATIVDGTDQQMTVFSSEPGATCEFTREGEIIGALAQTPGTLVLDKSRKNVRGVCRKEGFQETMVIIEPDMVATTAGNIIAGGVVGLAVDAASGANFNYPQSVYFQMAPVSFTSETEREQFFAAAEDRINQEYAPNIAKVKEKCERTKDEDCFALTTLEERRDAQLADLQSKKQQARIEASQRFGQRLTPGAPPSAQVQ